jgi:hypothetical protein
MTDAALDSRAEIVELEDAPYVASESGDSSWGQPPVSHYFLIVRGSVIYGQTISGVYLHAPEPEKWAVADPGLHAELAAWEAASDQDFWEFEEGLEE